MQIKTSRKLLAIFAAATIGAISGLVEFIQPASYSLAARATADPALAENHLEQIEKISGFFNRFQTLTGQFTQIGPRGNVAYGVFYVSKPGKMRFEYHPPSPYLIVSDGTWLIIKNKKNQRTDYYPLSATPLKLVLSRKVDLANQAKILEVANKNGWITLTLADKNRSVPGQLSLVYNEAKAAVEQWTIIDGQGRRTTITLSELATGGQHDEALFRVKRPRGSIGRGHNR